MSVKLVAEIGCIHLGSMDRAKRLIELATLCKADYVKFQKRNPHESVPKDIQNKPHPNPHYAYGDTYLQHRLNLELSIDQHVELKRFCDSCGIKYATSVWDLTSAREIVQLNPDYIKIPSACNSNYELIEYLTDEYKGDIHISTGMMTNEEKVDLFSLLKETIKDRVVIYHCTSEYPCPFERLYLKEIERLKSLNLFKAIGFSNHGYGISSDIAAIILGAAWIERHFTDDRVIRHNDAAASLEPDGLRRLARDIKAVEAALKYRENDMTEEEQKQRAKLKTDLPKKSN